MKVKEINAGDLLNYALRVNMSWITDEREEDIRSSKPEGIPEAIKDMVVKLGERNNYGEYERTFEYMCKKYGDMNIDTAEEVSSFVLLFMGRWKFYNKVEVCRKSASSRSRRAKFQCRHLHQSHLQGSFQHLSWHNDS